jgi:NADH dehydrogenase FAD-containing subunit
MMQTMDSPQQYMMGNAPLQQAGIEVIVGEAVRIDAGLHEVELAAEDNISYERLVLAMETEAVRPPIPGVEKEGEKNCNH